jgi:hypothetical protein
MTRGPLFYADRINAPYKVCPRARCPPAAGRPARYSDTVFLSLDHQSGRFKTVEDINVAALRRNMIMLAELATLLKILGHHHRVGAWRSERTAHAGDPRVRARCGVRAAKSEVNA